MRGPLWATEVVLMLFLAFSTQFSLGALSRFLGGGGKMICLPTFRRPRLYARPQVFVTSSDCQPTHSYRSTQLQDCLLSNLINDSQRTRYAASRLSSTQMILITPKSNEAFSRNAVKFHGEH